MEVSDIIRRLNNLRNARVGKGFHLGLSLLPLHVRTLLEHLLLIRKLPVELLKLVEHLCHLLRHVVWLCEYQSHRSLVISNPRRNSNKEALRYHEEKVLVSTALRCM